MTNEAMVVNWLSGRRGLGDKVAAAIEWKVRFLCSHHRRWRDAPSVDMYCRRRGSDQIEEHPFDITVRGIDNAKNVPEVDQIQAGSGDVLMYWYGEPDDKVVGYRLVDLHALRWHDALMVQQGKGTYWQTTAMPGKVIIHTLDVRLLPPGIVIDDAIPGGAYQTDMFGPVGVPV